MRDPRSRGGRTAGHSGQAGPASPSGPASPVGQRPPGGWRECTPELVILACLIVASGVAIYGYAGQGAAEIALIGWGAVILVVLRILVPPSTSTAPDEEQDRRGERGRTSFIGFWRKRGMLTDASTSMVSYDNELRQTLQHLLAARLAERHGISLYADPAAARAALLPGGRDSALWYWLDPGRPAESEQGQRGIPPRTLAAILDRLEQL